MAVFGLFFIYPLVYGDLHQLLRVGDPREGAGRNRQHAELPRPSTTTRSSIARCGTPSSSRSSSCRSRWRSGSSIALVINAKIRGRAFFRSAFYFPSIVSSAAITTIAIFILNPDGLLNKIIGSNQAWFGDSSTALYSVVGLNAWTTAGTVMLFYLAALQSIPTDVYEAAAVDGTGALAHVLADHLPASQAGPLLRARRVRHRRAQGLRPVLHRLRTGRAGPSTRR